MVGFTNKFNIVKNKIKKIVDTSSKEEQIEKFGSYWQNKSDNFYEDIYNETPKIHEFFKDWYAEQKNIQTILDVGCGSGIYGRTFFNDKSYSGIDISKKAVEIAKTNDKNKMHNYIACDFIADDILNDKKFDLVFSLSVIDHVYDPDEFLKKCIQLSDRYVLIVAYWGYFPDLGSHNIDWHPETTCYQNQLSIMQIQNLLNPMNLKYSIDSLSYEKRGKSTKATIIIIEKNQ